MVLTIAMLWGIRGKGRGLFSALLTFVCVLVAGAVAFGLWEVVTQSVFLGWRPDLAWGLGLALPFAVMLGVLRLLVEVTVPKNIKVDDLTNFIGGAVFGLGSAIITTGIVVLSVGSVNFGPDFLKYEPIVQDGGDLVHSNGLWVPVDKWTTALYEHLSVYSFDAGTGAMALRHPDLYEHVSMNRLVYGKETDKGRTLARNDLQKGEAKVISAYSGPNLSAFAESATVDAPTLNPKDTHGESFPAGSTMAGYVVEFAPGAREAGGQVVVGFGQVRLVYSTGARSADAVHPHAIISDPEVTASSKVWFPRNAKEIFVPSVGGESQTVMGFEFALPPGATPTDLIIKGMRVPLQGLEVREFATSVDRDSAIVSGDLFAGAGVSDAGNLDRSQAVQSNVGVNATHRMGNRSINVTSGIPGTLKLDTDKRIIGGKAEFLNPQLNNRGLAQNNRADSFGATNDTRVVQITLSDGGNATPMGSIVQRTGLNGRPRVIDSNGKAYDAVGYIYSNGIRTWIRYEPGKPLASMSEVEDQLSTTARDQTLILLFRPSANVTITGFAIGETLVGEFNMPLL